MDFFTQSINDHVFDTLQFFHACLRYEIRICDISEVINTECRDRKFVVHYRDGFYFNIINPEWNFIYHMDIHFRNTGITEFRESIIIILADNVFSPLITIDVNFSIFDPIKSSNIVQSPDMIFMFMRQQQGCHVFYPCS